MQAADIGKRIFGVAIGPNADLAMSLDANWSVKLRGALGAAATAIGVVGILLLLVRWRPRRAVYPLILALATLVLVILTDATFIGGYRPFDGGDDGLIFSGFARDMLQHLVAGDIAGALKGVERCSISIPACAISARSNSCSSATRFCSISCSFSSCR